MLYIAKLELEIRKAKQHTMNDGSLLHCLLYNIGHINCQEIFKDLGFFLIYL